MMSEPFAAGKSHTFSALVRAAVRARHGDDQTSSPTFTFWHRYPGDPPIDHLDLYRIEHPNDVQELGLEDAFGGESIAFIEWWMRAPALLPRQPHEIAIAGAGDGPRRVTIVR
jgi:tRNA threonylcarbamoyl adenosine modification protein YjeE